MAAPHSIDAATHPGDSSAAAAVFDVRPFESGDMAFVRDSWLRSAWHREDRRLRLEGKSRNAREIAGAAWYGINRAHVTTLIGTADVLVAVDKTDTDHIGGWMAVAEGEPLYAYVKNAYRGWGIAKLLADTAGVEWKR